MLRRSYVLIDIRWRIGPRITTISAFPSKLTSAPSLDIAAEVLELCFVVTSKLLE